jgi:hypothetical protein
VLDRPCASPLYAPPRATRTRATLKMAIRCLPLRTSTTILIATAIVTATTSSSSSALQEPVPPQPSTARPHPQHLQRRLHTHLAQTHPLLALLAPAFPPTPRTPPCPPQRRRPGKVVSACSARASGLAAPSRPRRGGRDLSSLSRRKVPPAAHLRPRGVGLAHPSGAVGHGPLDPAARALSQ